MGPTASPGNASARNKLKRITKQDAILCAHSSFVFCCFWRVLFGYGSRSMRAYSSVLYHLHEAAASSDPHIPRSSYPHYISQLAGNALRARTILLGSVKIISNAIARSIDRRQNIVPRKSAQQRRHVDAKQQVRNASARNKRKRINKARCNRLCSFVNHPFTQLMHRGGNTRSDMSEIAGE